MDCKVEGCTNVHEARGYCMKTTCDGIATVTLLLSSMIAFGNVTSDRRVTATTLSTDGCGTSAGEQWVSRALSAAHLLSVGLTITATLTSASLLVLSLSMWGLSRLVTVLTSTTTSLLALLVSSY